MRRIGLARRHHIAPGHPIEIAGEVIGLEDLKAGQLEFIGADHRPIALLAQKLERLRYLGIDPGIHRGMAEIERAITLEQGFIGLGLECRPAGLQRTCDQRGGAVADQPAHGFERQRPAAKLRQKLVQRVGEIGGAVDQRAVEIEDETAAGGCHSPVTSV